MNEERVSIEVTIKNRSNDEEFKFTSIRKASEYMGISAMQLSRILRNKRRNTTGYFVTTD